MPTRQWASFLPAVLIGIAVGFLALFLWYYGLAIAAVVVSYFAVAYYRRRQLARVGLLLATAGGTYAALLARIYLVSLADPAVGMPFLSQIAMWAGLVTTNLSKAGDAALRFHIC